MAKFEKGTILATLNGDQRTNAIVVSVDNNQIKILTDFGNLLTYTSASLLEKEYKISTNFLLALEIDYPLLSIEDRIDQQIELLTLAKEILHG